MDGRRGGAVSAVPTLPGAPHTHRAWPLPNARAGDLPGIPETTCKRMEAPAYRERKEGGKAGSFW